MNAVEILVRCRISSSRHRMYYINFCAMSTFYAEMYDCRGNGSENAILIVTDPD